MLTLNSGSTGKQKLIFPLTSFFFIQDQFSRVVETWQSILISATLFAMTHIPIAIFIYEIEGWIIGPIWSVLYVMLAFVWIIQTLLVNGLLLLCILRLFRKMRLII